MAKKYYRYNDEKGQVEWVGGDNFFEPLTDELALKADKTELFSGSYDDLTNKPSIPSASDVAKGVTAHGWGDHSVAGYAKTKADVGLGNVDDTSDANKPISTATQAALDTKVNTDDSRLANSREWTASTVSQAEAEAGTSTTRRAWTAQRVRQAIQAWFSSVSGTIGRTILGRSTAAQVRGDLGLGTAATRDVGTSSGNVMEVGAFGISGRTYPYDRTVIGFLNALRTQRFTSGAKAFEFDNHPDWYSGYVLGTGSDNLSASKSGILMSTHEPVVSFFYGSDIGDTELPSIVHLHHTGNVLKSTGNNDNFPMSQKAVTDALNNLPTPEAGLGVGQTWQDVTSQRSFDTTYTNTTGRAICVSIFAGVSSTDPAGPHLHVDGVLLGAVDIGPNDGSNARIVAAQLFAVVPPASEYRLTLGGGAQLAMQWNELR